MLELYPAHLPIDLPALKVWPRGYGMSIASLVVARNCNIKETINIFADCGVTFTRVNLLTALWPEANVLPFRQRWDGLWDLTDWNPEYFDRLSEVRDRANSAGIVVQWTNYELYSWSARKAGSQQLGTPWRNNINRVYWPADDSTFQLLPDPWSMQWFRKVVPYLRLNPNVFEIGNEFPEKELHWRVLHDIRSIQPDALIQVNRNEDTPGQYSNMMSRVNYDFIAFHGRQLKSIRPVKNTAGKIIWPMGDLDRPYPKEPNYRTFNHFFDRCPHEPRRIIFSSDGARISADTTDTYDWGPLREFAQEVVEVRGCSFEHQSRAKMTPPPNHHKIESQWFVGLRA